MEKTISKEKTPSKLNAQKISSLAPIIGLVLVVVVFTILTQGQILQKQILMNMVKDGIVTALAAIGAVFVFGAGYFDMSMGGCVCFATVVGAMAGIATGSMTVIILVVFGISLVFGFLKGLFASFVNVPFFIFTIVLGSVMSSMVITILGTKSIIKLSDAKTELPKLDGQTTYPMLCLICLIVFFLVCVYLFKLNSLGSKVKNLGGNKIAAKQSGINSTAVTIAVFMLSSVGLGLASILTMLRTRTVGTGTAGSLGNDIMVALVLGGMPLSGGPKSKISAGLIGAATITFLNYGLQQMQMTAGTIQMVRGIVFIVVVFISSFSYRGKLLPR
ncbi:MAG: hypothetical protein E7282_04535 [Lachnospiraceae bacterium]|nr:hypothetical protein [Lachnospiraceae bacterium]